MSNPFLQKSLKLDLLPEYALGIIAEKVHSLRSKGIDIIDCSQLNPSMPPSQVALDKLVQTSLLSHNHRYSSSSGIGLLREAFSDYYHSKFNAKLDPAKEIVITSGTKGGLYQLLLGIVSPGDTVLVPTPSYPVHTTQVCLAGAGFVGVPLWKSYDEMLTNNSILNKDSEFFFAELQNRYNSTWPRPKVFICNFPHNPTTTVVTECFYKRLLSFARTNNVLIINDFAHGDLSFKNGSAVSILSIPDAKYHAVELYSISKGFSLPGWRIGSASGSESIISILKTVKSYLDFGVFQPLQLAAVSILKHELNSDSISSGVTEEVRSVYRSRQEDLISGLRRLSWKVSNSMATPFVWACLPEQLSNMNSQDFATKLLETKYVATSPGLGFDPDQKKTVRFSLLPNDSQIRIAIERIAEFQEEFKNES